MAVQFAGSGSTADRRRRRLAVGADANVDAALAEGDGADIESQLVASAAAAPWVPVTESRIWIFATLIGVGLGLLTFGLVRPIGFPSEIKSVSDRFLGGTRPLAVVCIETFFLAISTQLAILIGWYRHRCKLDFGGRHRVWPWVATLVGTVAFCCATDFHLMCGSILGTSQWLPWRGSTVAWLLPLCVVALPISLLIDRDVRNSTSSLLMLRFSGLLWLGDSLLEIYRPEMQSTVGFDLACLLTPVYASAALFVGLWLHARVVAYVCPDPPEQDEPSAWSVVMSALIWISARLMFWRRASVEATNVDEEVEKPKRRRKKLEGDETATPRKRRTPAKRSTPRTRTRTKTADEDETVDSGESSSESEIETVKTSTAVSSAASDLSENYADESDDQNDELPPPVKPASGSKQSDRNTQVHQSHGSGVPAPHSRFQSAAWNPPQQAVEAEENMTSESRGSNEDSDDDQEASDLQISPDQLKGLSKRQKRDLKKQLREQQRARGR